MLDRFAAWLLVPFDRLAAWLLDHPQVQVRVWILATFAWAILTPVTMLSFLSHSLPWVSFMSLFANTASCATAAVAGLAFVRAASADRKAAHVIEHSPDIPQLD